MKKLRLTFNSILLSIAMLLTLGITFLLPGFKLEENTSYAATEEDTSYVRDFTAQSIPYALITQKKDGPNYLYRNYDYNGEYIMLTSNSIDDSALYNTTVYVKFNEILPESDKTSNRVPAASLNVIGYLNGKPINVPKASGDPTNGYVNYAISFRETTVMTWADDLSAIDPQDRSGLYQFEFTYRFQTPGSDGVTSDEEFTLSMSFNLIDKEDYLTTTTAYSITGAEYNGTTEIKGVDHETYFFNYNRYDADGNIQFPVVGYEANKFALNYLHTIGSSSYEHKYSNFTPNYLESEILDPNFEETNVTGRVAITKIGSSDIKYYDTYKRTFTSGVEPDIVTTVCPYYAEIDLSDLGEYKFYVDILIPTPNAFTVTYEVAEIPDLENSEVKFLTNFGYQITYKDQASNKYKPLRNAYTYADILAINEKSTTAAFSLPDSIPVTDQAPIKFNYYATAFDTANSGYKIYATLTEATEALATMTSLTYEQLLASNKLDTTFHETSKFDMQGIYLVKACYSVETSYGNTIKGIQMFFFEIRTAAPALVVEYDTTDEGTTFDLLTSKFTNKNVRFKILNDVNSFNAPITVKYTRYASFNTIVTGNGTYVSTKIDDDYYSYTMEGSKYSIPKSFNGRYVITVTYSPSKLNQYYEYIVDTSDIQDIIFNKVSYEEDGSYYIAQPTTIAQPTISEGVYDLALTNSPFTLSWKEKPWAAYTVDGITTTNVTAYFLPIDETNEDPEYFEEYDKTLTNGYGTDTAAPLNYANSWRSIRPDNLQPLTSQQYQSANGIYFFYVEDLAGNWFERMILIDDTTPVFMQQSLIDQGDGNPQWLNSYDMVANPANYVRTNTRLTFGKNKGLVYNYLNTEENEIFNTKLAGTTLLKGFPEVAPTHYFINVPINTVHYMKDFSSSANLYSPDDFAVIELTTSGGGVFAGEGYYEFTSHAANGTEVFMYISMNFDGAAGQFYMSGDYTGDTTERYVATNNGSNLYKLSFKFKSGSEKTEVVRIEYKYYPFDYVSQTSSYPFAINPEKSADLILPEYDQDEDFLYTISNINLDNGKTAPGKYVLTRYYYGGGYQLINGVPVASDYGEYDINGQLVDFGQDTFTRNYTIYVDHNGIISTTTQNGLREVGEHISITIGKGTSNEYTFKNFFRNVSAGSPILTTNKLPIQINIPVYKYFIDNGSANTNVMSRLYYNNLDVVIKYKDTTSQYAPTITHNIKDATLEGYFIIPTFTAEGTYTITISDRSGYNAGTSRNVNPMIYTCSFIVRHTYPSGEVYLQDELLEPSETDDKTFATNAKKDKKVEFVWQDAPDPYTASVVELNITAAGLEGKDTFLVGDYNLENIISGTDFFDYSEYKYIRNIVVVKLSSDTFENKIYNQYKFYVQLNIDEEFDFNIEIRYAVSSELNHGYGQYVSTSYRLKIDRTKPMLNIDNLLEKDTYLVTNKYYDDITDLKENFKEEKAVYGGTNPIPTIYDYAFAVDAQTFKLIYDGEDTISRFYFRQYAKFDTENQSISPDHPDYTNLNNFSNFPRFDITESNADYYLANYAIETPLANIIASASATDINSLANNYYEIIEKDLAGNYRIFTVYFKPNTLHNILSLDATSGGGALDTTNPETTTTSDIVMKGVKSATGWAKLNIKNVTDASRTPLNYTLTPYLGTATIYNMCNEISNYLLSTTNCKITFTLTSAAGVSTKHFNIVKTNSKLPIPDVLKNEDGTFYMIFPKKTATSVIYLVALSVQYNPTKEYVVNAIGVDNIPGQKDNLKAGLYIIKYTDNTNSSYTYQLNLGIDYVSASDQFRYATGTAVDGGDGITYAGGDIYITFQSKAHGVAVKNTTNGTEGSDTMIFADKYNNINPNDYVLINGENYYRVNPDIYIKAVEDPTTDNGFRVILIKEPTIDDGVSNEDIGGIKKYNVTFYYSNYNDAGADRSPINEYKFVIYNKLAAINLFDANGNAIAGSTTSGSMALTSSSVKINWEGLTDAPHASLYRPVVVLNSLTESGSVISSIEITNNRIISTPGYYAVELCNTAFGNYRTVYFAIQDGEIPFYTVVDSTSGAAISVSPKTLDILGSLDTTHTVSVKSQIQKHIETTYELDPDHKNLLINKLNACPTNVDQYFSLNDCDLRLDASSDLYYIPIYFRDGTYVADTSTVTRDKYLTTFYLIYGDNNPIYANLIAVTRVPRSATNIVANKLYYIYTTTSEVSKELTGVSATIKNNELDNDSVHIYWNTVSNDNEAWYNRGNLVYLNYTFNNVTSVRNYGEIGYSSTVTATCGLSKITVSGSGKHMLTFVDLAGNVSFFKTASNTSQAYYTVTILDKVIFTVNNSTPLDYAVYNSAITLSIDTSYSSDYSINSLSVTVMRNGSYYENYIITDNTKYTFTESGRYIVTLDATYQDTTPLNSAHYNFTILDKTSARLAYEFNEMLGYEVTRVYKDNKDITTRVKQFYIAEQGLDIEPEEYKLNEFFASSEKFGNGDYIITIAVKYNVLLAAKEFTFGFKISDVIPVIMSDPAYGETTKGTITLTFNPSHIYQQIGKSSIKVFTYNADTNRFNLVDEYIIDESKLAITEATKFQIKETNSYYFQLVTDSGNIVTSFRINRAEPLNALSIIIIVIASVTVVVLVILFIKMRTKMKVR